MNGDRQVRDYRDESSIPDMRRPLGCAPPPEGLRGSDSGDYGLNEEGRLWITWLPVILPKTAVEIQPRVAS